MCDSSSCFFCCFICYCSYTLITCNSAEPGPRANDNEGTLPEVNPPFSNPCLGCAEWRANEQRMTIFPTKWRANEQLGGGWAPTSCAFWGEDNPTFNKTMKPSSFFWKGNTINLQIDAGIMLHWNNISSRRILPTSLPGILSFKNIKNQICFFCCCRIFIGISAVDWF